MTLAPCPALPVPKALPPAPPRRFNCCQRWAAASEIDRARGCAAVAGVTAATTASSTSASGVTRAIEHTAARVGGREKRSGISGDAHESRHSRRRRRRRYANCCHAEEIAWSEPLTALVRNELVPLPPCAGETETARAASLNCGYTAM